MLVFSNLLFQLKQGEEVHTAHLVYTIVKKITQGGDWRNLIKSKVGLSLKITISQTSRQFITSLSELKMLVTCIPFSVSVHLHITSSLCAHAFYCFVVALLPMPLREGFINQHVLCHHQSLTTIIFSADFATLSNGIPYHEKI